MYRLCFRNRLLRTPALLWLAVASTLVGTCNAAEQDSSSSVPYLGLSFVDSWDGIEEAIELIFGNSSQPSTEQLQRGIKEYSLQLSRLSPESREYGLTLIQRAMCHQALFNFDAAKRDLDLALCNPNAVKYKRENGLLTLTNLPSSQRDLDLIFAKLNLYGYLGTRSDVCIVNDSTICIRDLGFDLLDIVESEVQKCPFDDNISRTIATGLYAAMPIDPMPINPPQVGDKHGPDQFGRDRQRPRNKITVEQCQDACMINIRTLDAVLALCPVPIALKFLGGLTLEYLLRVCERCCASGEFYRNCLQPIISRTANVRQYLADIGNWPDPMWSD